MLARGIQLGPPPLPQFQEDLSKCSPMCRHQRVSSTKYCLLNTDAVLGQHFMKLNPVRGDYKLESRAKPLGILPRIGRGLGFQKALKLFGFEYVQ